MKIYSTKVYEAVDKLLKISFSCSNKLEFDKALEQVKTLEGRAYNTKFPKKWSAINSEKNMQQLQEWGFKDKAEKAVEIVVPQFVEHLSETIPEKGFELLFDYQKEALKFIKHANGRALISLPMGSGKTFVALYYAKMETSCKSILVICPSSIKLQWERECRKVLPGHTVDVLYKKTPYIPNRSNFYIINWDILAAWKDMLCQMRFDIIVSDEVQAIGNTSNRTKAYKEIIKSQKCNHIAMSGTPIRSKVRQFFNVLNLLDEKKFPSEFAFWNRYCDPKYTPFGMKYDGATNIGELREKLNPIMFIKDKKEIFKDCPEKQRIIVPMELTDYGKYSTLLEKVIEEGSSEQRMMELQRTAFPLKRENVLKWLEETSALIPKLVVFAWHRSVVEFIHAEFEESSVVIYGGMTAKEKDDALSQFKTNDKIGKLIINIGACPGIDGIQDFCSTGVFVELATTESDMKQAEDRLDRIRQKEKVYIYYLVGRGTIDERFAEILEKNSKINNDLLYGGKGDEITIMNALENR